MDVYEKDDCHYLCCCDEYTFRCKLGHSIIEDEDCEEYCKDDCLDYTPRQRCDDCIHVHEEVWETGTIDQINYRCKLQNNKIIYRDVNLMRLYSDWPDCNIGKFEPRGKSYVP